MENGDTATVVVDGKAITGTVYNVRDNGWPCVETASGRVASGPRLHRTVCVGRWGETFEDVCSCGIGHDH